MSYQSLIQKDLPVATWALDDSSITTNATAAADKYVTGRTQPNGNSYDGKYLTSSMSKKEHPFVFGSPQSLIVDAAAAGSARLQIPSLDRFSILTANDAGSFEFWIKPVTNSLSVPSTMTKIVSKNNSQTGVYIHNSSIIGIIGDSAGNIAKAVVNLPTMRKPMHIVLSYTINSVSITVNGQRASATTTSNVFTKTYAAADEYFTFYTLGSQFSYAIDHVAIYARALDIQTCRRHMVYGLGYEPSSQIASKHGGVRYNFSTAQNQICGKYEKGNTAQWSNAFSTSNIQIENGYLRISEKSQPEFKTAKDKTSLSLNWATESSQDYAYPSSGSYLELQNAQYIANSNDGGFGFCFYRPTADTIYANNVEKTLAYVENANSDRKYLRFFIVGVGGTTEAVKADLDGTVYTLFTTTTGKLSGQFSVAYFYDTTNQQITLYVGTTQAGTSGANNGVAISNTSFVSGKTRLFSTPAYEENQEYVNVVAGDDNHFTGGIQKITHLKTKPTTTSTTTIYNTTASAVNNYSASANTSYKRFVISSNGQYTFYIDLKQLTGVNDFIGNHRIEWGYDGNEVVVTATGVQDGANWLSAFPVTNRSAVAGLIDEAPSTSKALKIDISISATDVEDNPTKIYYFRFLSYLTTLSGSNYITNIVSDGPAVSVVSTTSRTGVMPYAAESPFLFNEEFGGLEVANTATITYNHGTVSGADTSTGIFALSFFANIPSFTGTIFSIVDGATTVSLSASSTTLSGVGTSAIYVNGVASTTLIPGKWSHYTVVFSSRLTVDASLPLITLGNGSTTIWFDELLVLDESLTSTDIQNIYNVYKGTNAATVGNTDATNRVVVYDSEIKNSAEIYQPIGSQDAVLNQAKYASVRQYTLSGTSPNFTIPYSSIEDIVVDGLILKQNDRILLKNQSTTSQNGLYLVAAAPAQGTALALTKDTTPTNGDIVYIYDGLQNEDKHFLYNSSAGTWTETYVLPKIKAYSLPKNPVVIDVETKVEV